MKKIEQGIVRQKLVAASVFVQPEFRRLVAEVAADPNDISRILALQDVETLRARGVRVPENATFTLEVSSTEELDLTRSPSEPQAAKVKIRLCFYPPTFPLFKVCADFTIEPKE
jgi:hypothetical protein